MPQTRPDGPAGVGFRQGAVRMSMEGRVREASGFSFLQSHCSQLMSHWSLSPRTFLPVPSTLHTASTASSLSIELSQMALSLSWRQELPGGSLGLLTQLRI